MKRHFGQTRIAAALAAVALLLAGCFEITKDAAFRENGEARVEIEMALAAELAALLKNPAFAKQMTKEGAPDLFADCGKPTRLASRYGNLHVRRRGIRPGRGRCERE
jgi:hypothetical protein